MSKVQLQGNVSGTGVFTIASPNSNTDRTLTLPDVSGTIQTTGAAIARSQLPAGSILQVQNVVMQGIFGNASPGTYALVSDGVNPLQLTITKTNSSSRLILMSNINSHSHNAQGGGFVVVRGSSYNSANVLQPPTSPGSRTITNIGGTWTGDGAGDSRMMMNVSSMLSDSPGAGTFTYGIYCTTIAGTQGGTRVNVAATDGDTDNIDYFRAISTFTIMEVAV
jgi:hypothetical protein